MAWIAPNRYLNSVEQENNALIFADYFIQRNWSLNAIAAMLGNIQVESSINPGIFESLLPHTPEAIEEYYENNHRYPGYGLVQWTPYTKFTNWAGPDWETDHDRQLDRIQYEMEHETQWSPYAPITFRQFSTSIDDPVYLAGLFELYYEIHAGDPQPQRGAYAMRWLKFLGGSFVPIWLLAKRKRRCKPYV